MPGTERAAEEKILIAVDFGTTFSSVIWEQTGEVSGQHIIQDWPNEDSTFHPTTDTVPTILKYDSFYRYRWGYQIQDQEQRYEWFKLGLDPSMQQDRSSLARKYPATTRIPIQLSSNNAVTPQILTTHYLKALRQHAESMLEQNHVFEAVLRRTQREYVITVPAVWKEKARDLTAKCAVDAGMGSEDDLHIVSEPEAAAMYAISKFREINPGVLNEGDTFVLCDAGGGTVDLISYTIQTLDPIIELEEAAPGSGSACGSIFLNRIFAETLNERFKGDRNWESDPQISSTAMEHFERVTKNEFNGTKGSYIPVAGVEHPDIKKYRLELSSTEIKDIFEPVISEILSLIQDQIQQTAKKVKLILLVGGFGKSTYLKSRIEEAFGPEIAVKRSPNSDTAVVRGALMKGLAEFKGLTTKVPRIVTRKARKAYGTECVKPYRERRYPGDDGHSPERRMAINHTGKYYVQTMRWFLHKGDTIIEDDPAVFNFSTDQLISGGRPEELNIPIYCHEDPGNTGAPQYHTRDVHKLGTVTADIHSIDLSLFKRDRGYYVMDFDVEMKCIEARLEFTPIFLYGQDSQMRMRCPPAVFQFE